MTDAVKQEKAPDGSDQELPDFDVESPERTAALAMEKQEGEATMEGDTPPSAAEDPSWSKIEDLAAHPQTTSSGSHADAEAQVGSGTAAE